MMMIALESKMLAETVRVTLNMTVAAALGISGREEAAALAGLAAIQINSTSVAEAAASWAAVVLGGEHGEDESAGASASSSSGNKAVLLVVGCTEAAMASWQ